MAKKKHPIIFLLLTLMGGVGVILLVLFTSPTGSVQLGPITIPMLLAFVILFFLCIFSLITYIFFSKTHGVLTGLLAISLFYLKINNLTQPFYLILLIALFVTLEFLFSYKH